MSKITVIFRDSCIIKTSFHYLLIMYEPVPSAACPVSKGLYVNGETAGRLISLRDATYLAGYSNP